MESQIRVAGSGFTTLVYDGKPIAWLEAFQDSGQTALNRGYEAITPLADQSGQPSRHPQEIVTGRVLDAGSLTASIRETWNEPVWQSLSGLAGTESITDVWEALAQRSDLVTCQMTIRPPGNRPWRGKVYHGCVVTAIDDGERVDIGALSVLRNITIVYTHTTPVRQAAG